MIQQSSGIVEESAWGRQAQKPNDPEPLAYFRRWRNVDALVLGTGGQPLLIESARAGASPALRTHALERGRFRNFLTPVFPA